MDPLLEIVGYLQLPTVPYGLVNASRPRNKLRTRSPFSVGFGADFKSSGLNSGQNRLRVSPVHSHA